MLYACNKLWAMIMTTCCEHPSDPAKNDKFCDVTPNIQSSFKHFIFCMKKFIYSSVKTILHMHYNYNKFMHVEWCLIEIALT